MEVWVRARGKWWRGGERRGSRKASVRVVGVVVGEVDGEKEKRRLGFSRATDLGKEGEEMDLRLGLNRRGIFGFSVFYFFSGN